MQVRHDAAARALVLAAQSHEKWPVLMWLVPVGVYPRGCAHEPNPILQLLLTAAIAIQHAHGRDVQGHVGSKECAHQQPRVAVVHHSVWHAHRFHQRRHRANVVRPSAVAVQWQRPHVRLLQEKRQPPHDAGECHGYALQAV